MRTVRRLRDRAPRSRWSGWAIPSTTASTMGTIMAVVAVFEIHIDRNMVISMKPNMSLEKTSPMSQSGTPYMWTANGSSDDFLRGQGIQDSKHRSRRLLTKWTWANNSSSITDSLCRPRIIDWARIQGIADSSLSRGVDYSPETGNR